MFKMLDRAVTWKLDSRVIGAFSLRYVPTSCVDCSLTPRPLCLVQADTSSLCRTVRHAARTPRWRLAHLTPPLARPWLSRSPPDQAGDKICLFGFSRGADTARVLAGMLIKVGLLPPYNQHQIPFAYEVYSRTGALSQERSAELKKMFFIDVSVEFIGVW